MQSRHTTRMTGKTDAARSPLWMSLPFDWVPNPTRDGPSVPPTSPARASKAKSAVPPLGMRADVRLIEPGHIIPTANPLIIHPRKATIGMGDKDAVR